jgi:CRP-like cAMP-binding protein
MHPEASTNRLIDRLPNAEQKRLFERCETVDLAFGEVLCNANVTMPFAWFPLTGVIAREAKVNDRPPMEIGLSGNEGMLGATLVIGIETAPYRAVVQGPGTALRIAAADFVALLAECPTLEHTMQRYLYVMDRLASRSTPCTRFHGIEERLSYWLLMIDDRTHEDHFDLTHQYMADMLGVQRSAVTLAASTMQANGLISYSRGQIHVVSRAGLLATCCECYDESIRDYTRQFPAWSAKKPARKTARKTV